MLGTNASLLYNSNQIFFQVVKVQQTVRQFLARTRLRKLKSETCSRKLKCQTRRSISGEEVSIYSHGMENKIYSLTIKLNDKEKTLQVWI